MTTGNPVIELAEWRQGGETFEFRGLKIFTRRGGNPAGPALMLIHGFPTASWDWYKLWPTLAKHFSLYTLDMIGYGDSAKPVRFGYRIHDQADLVEDWLHNCGVKHYHILAHDYGNTVTQELMARDLERRESAANAIEVNADLQLDSVCLLNGGLFPEAHRPLFIQKILLSPLGPLVARLTNKRKFAANLTHIFGPKTPPSAPEIDNLWQLVTRNGGLAAMPKLITYMPQRKHYRERWVGALCRHSIPVRLIDGLVDPISGANMVARYRELVPSPDVVELAGIGHYPQIEAAEDVLDAFLDFHRNRVN